MTSPKPIEIGLSSKLAAAAMKGRKLYRPGVPMVLASRLCEIFIPAGGWGLNVSNPRGFGHAVTFRVVGMNIAQDDCRFNLRSGNELED